MEHSLDSEENYVSLKMLKNNMKDALKKSGVLCSVKAQVRREFINNLASPGGNSNHAAAEEEDSQSQLCDQELLFRCAVFHFLRAKQYDYTLSVYTAECGVDGRAMLSEAEVAKKLHLPPPPMQKTTGNSIANNSIDSTRNPSPLEMVMQELIRRTETVCVESGTQSDYSGAGIREMLDSRMTNISRTFEAKKEQERLFPNRGIEEKMLTFQRNCEQKMQEDLSSQLSSMRTVELARVRLEEAHSARQELEAMRAELEGTYERRMLVQAEKEADSLRVAADKERHLQQAQYEARQQLQRELDDLRARERNTSKKAELDQHGLQLFESRLKESQLLLESREREVGRREREAEHAIRDATEKAREEARDRLSEEVQGLLRERAGLKTERTRLDADREGWDAVVTDAASWRSKCTTLESNVALRDEEIISLKHRIARLEFKQKLEMIEIAELTGMTAAPVDGVQPVQGYPNDPTGDQIDTSDGVLVTNSSLENSAKSARTQHLLGLIQRNAELGARTTLLEQLESEGKANLLLEREFRHQVEGQLRQKQEELDRVVSFSKEFTVRVERERRRAQKEIENLRQLCAVEKGRAVVASNQRQEIEHLVQEQRDAIHQLQKTHHTMGHVRSIKDRGDNNDNSVDRNGAGTSVGRGQVGVVRTPNMLSASASSVVPTSAAHMKQLQAAAVAAELEWIRQRELAIELNNANGGLGGGKREATPVNSTTTVTTANANGGMRAAPGGQSRTTGSYVYGHEGRYGIGTEQPSSQVVTPAADRHSRTTSIIGTAGSFPLETQEAIARLDREHEEYVVEHAKRAGELKRVKDMLQKQQQQEENELDELRRSSEDFADKLRQKKEDELLEKELDLQQREMVIAKQQQQYREEQEEREVIERRDAALVIAADNRTKLSAAFDIESRRQIAEAEALASAISEKEQMLVAAQDLQRAQDLTAHHQYDVDARLESAQQDKDLALLVERTEVNGKAATEKDRLLAEQRSRKGDNNSEREQLERGATAEVAVADETQAPQGIDEHEASHLLEKFHGDYYDNAERNKKNDAATLMVEQAKNHENEKRRLADIEEAEQQRLIDLAKEEERRVVQEEEKKRTDDAEAEAKASQVLEEEEKAEANRRKVAEEKSLAAKEEADRLRRTTEEADRQQQVDKEEAEDRRREEADRAAEEEANRQKEGDASALQAARAKVLARRKQKQERDSVESLASESGVVGGSLRNGIAATTAPSPARKVEDMSVISEIEVEKPLEHSQSDDDIWF